MRWTNKICSSCLIYGEIFIALTTEKSHHTVAPMCRAGQIHTYNVGRGETAKIQCEVMGIPNDINFVWKFNTSVSELLDMPSSIVTNDKTRSTIHFKPMTEHVIITAYKNYHFVSHFSFSPFTLFFLINFNENDNGETRRRLSDLFIAFLFPLYELNSV